LSGGGSPIASPGDFYNDGWPEWIPEENSGTDFQNEARQASAVYERSYLGGDPADESSYSEWVVYEDYCVDWNSHGLIENYCGYVEGAGEY